MINVRQHHPILLNRLKTHFEAGDANALNIDLQQLSAADFRSAGILLADELLPAYPQHFWSFFLEIVPTRTKAFLVTFLKAACTIYQKGNPLDFAILQNFSENFATPIDNRKCLEHLMPIMKTVDEVQLLLHIFPTESSTSQTMLLLKAATPICYYLLFKVLQSADESKKTLRNYCIYLMKEGDSLSFNMAVILQTYFDLPALPGTFSLKMEPYQLGRLNESFENFEKALTGCM